MPSYIKHKKALNSTEVTCKCPDWQEWLQAEWKQFDTYHQQSMFGDPGHPPLNANVFCWVWIYFTKEYEKIEKV